MNRGNFLKLAASASGPAPGGVVLRRRFNHKAPRSVQHQGVQVVAYTAELHISGTVTVAWHPWGDDRAETVLSSHRGVPDLLADTPPAPDAPHTPSERAALLHRAVLALVPPPKREPKRVWP